MYLISTKWQAYPEDYLIEQHIIVVPDTCMVHKHDCQWNQWQSGSRFSQSVAFVQLEASSWGRHVIYSEVARVKWSTYISSHCMLHTQYASLLGFQTDHQKASYCQLLEWCLKADAMLDSCMQRIQISSLINFCLPNTWMLLGTAASSAIVY